MKSASRSAVATLETFRGLSKVGLLKGTTWAQAAFDAGLPQASAVLFDAENPLNPVNRRISIIVMNKKTEEAASKDGGTLEVEEKGEVAGEVRDAGTSKP